MHTCRLCYPYAQHINGQQDLVSDVACIMIHKQMIKGGSDPWGD